MHKHGFSVDQKHCKSKCINVSHEPRANLKENAPGKKGWTCHDHEFRRGKCCRDRSCSESVQVGYRRRSGRAGSVVGAAACDPNRPWRGLDLDTLDAPEQPALRRRPRCYFCRALLISRRGPLVLRHFLQPYCTEAYRRMMMLLSVRQIGASRVALPIQHLLNFLPEPQGQGSLRPAGSLMMTSATAARQRLRQLA